MHVSPKGRSHDGEDSLAELAPFLADFTVRDGKTTAYLCHDFRCERPVTRVEDLVVLMGGAAE